MLLNALDGSLKIPMVTLSHHLDTSPIACSDDAGLLQPNVPIITYADINRTQISIAKYVHCFVRKLVNNWNNLDG